jgi:hypothetical protein
VEALAAALGTLVRDPLLRERMGRSGRERAAQFGWENITAKVEEYYSFVIRRLAASDSLPSSYSAPIPEAPARGVVTPGLWTSGPARDGAAVSLSD